MNVTRKTCDLCKCTIRPKAKHAVLTVPLPAKDADTTKLDPATLFIARWGGMITGAAERQRNFDVCLGCVAGLLTAAQLSLEERRTLLAEVPEEKLV